MKWIKFRNLGKHRPTKMWKIYIHSPQVIRAWTHMILKHLCSAPPGTRNNLPLHNHTNHNLYYKSRLNNQHNIGNDNAICCNRLKTYLEHLLVGWSTDRPKPFLKLVSPISEWGLKGRGYLNSTQVLSMDRLPTRTSLLVLKGPQHWMGKFMGPTHKKKDNGASQRFCFFLKNQESQNDNNH